MFYQLAALVQNFTIVGDQLTIQGNSLDFENIPIYRFNVTARDMGLVPLTDEAEVVITVIDENDNSPVFLPSDVYRADIAEGDYNGVYGSVLLVSIFHCAVAVYTVSSCSCRSTLQIWTQKNLATSPLKCFQKMIFFLSGRWRVE